MNDASLVEKFQSIVGDNNVLIKSQQTEYYRSGFRSGRGEAFAVVFPNSLVEQWKVIQACVDSQCIIIMQAAKTGITEGSSPSGHDYDRRVVIINIMKIRQIHLLDNGKQALCLPGTSLSQLEKSLSKIQRAPHSVIGSTTIGATVIGGIANNSGGALVKRGPAYTELSLYAQVDSQGQLHLINHLGIDNLGSSPEEILANIESGNFHPDNIHYDTGMASDREYDARVRDIESPIPSRFNADERRLFEASGCAGKIAVFAVRVDTYPAPKKEQIFYIATNDHKQLMQLRRDILIQFKELPEMAEYMHRHLFDHAKTYGKDSFLSMKHIHNDHLPEFFRLKGSIESFLERMPLLKPNLLDKALFHISQCLPNHLPERLLAFRDRYEHHLILKMSDDGIREAREYLQQNFSQENKSQPQEKNDKAVGYFECDLEESQSALLHRFSAAGTALRYATVNQKNVEGILAVDVALPRNDKDWVFEPPAAVKENLVHYFCCGHFMCHVFHQDYIFKKGTDTKKMKALILEALIEKGAKYPAEHNVGHLYDAESSLQRFYQELDPTNTFNPGIGKMSKHQRRCQCC